MLRDKFAGLVFLDEVFAGDNFLYRCLISSHPWSEHRHPCGCSHHRSPQKGGLWARRPCHFRPCQGLFV